LTLIGATAAAGETFAIALGLAAPAQRANATIKTSDAECSLSDEQRIKAVSRVFETGSSRPAYDYVEDLGDGRGYTVSHYGFCSGTGDLLLVLKAYSSARPGNSLERYIEEIAELSAAGSGNVERLDGFAAAWRSESSEPRLQAACEGVADQLYFEPALDICRREALVLPIARLIIFDTILQHGNGDDADSVGALLGAMPPHDDESTFLLGLLKRRKQVLLHANDPATRETWAESASRVDALAILVLSNPLLNSPLHVVSSDFDDVIC